MIRLRYTAAVAVLGAGLFTGVAYAQSGQSGQQSQPLTSILAGKKFTPPLKGQADIEFTQPVPKREKEMVVTTLQVKNISNGPIARLTVDETWYAKDGSLVTGGKGQINGLLQPGEVQTIKIETPYNTKMNSNNYQFTHVNGTVKPHKVKSFEEAAKEPAAKKASATKSSKKK